MEPIFIIVDLFCGAGGTTTGFVQAELEGNGIAKVIACVNHDPKAIKSHWANHPEVKHFEEDIRTLDLTDLVALANYYRIKYPDAYLILWASLECTNFSKAKGGQPRDADSRTLADHLDRYVVALQPDYIQIENVVEFMSWGPLDANGKPVSRKNGQDFMRWREIMCSHGYQDEWRELNSANFGAYTSRNRLFGIFARPGLPIAWPEPTHTKKPTVHSIHGDLQKWMAVKEVLDFNDEGESIFTRKTPLVDSSLERIYAGLLKFVANGDTSFIQKHFSGKPMGKVIPINGPAGVITTSANQSLVQTTFLTHYYSNGGELSSIESPSATISTRDRSAVVTCQPFLMPTNFDNKPVSIEQPSPTITANRKHHYLVQTKCGQLAIPVYEGDSPIMNKIKQFMAAFGIVDIKMRMLRVHELLRIQGFPVGYKLEGTQADQKKFIGNSVVPLVVKKWIESLAMRLIDNIIKVA
jgi:DNA (cytosine-5)-methyltransferase 1